MTEEQRAQTLATVRACLIGGGATAGVGTFWSTMAFFANGYSDFFSFAITVAGTVTLFIGCSLGLRIARDG